MRQQHPRLSVLAALLLAATVSGATLAQAPLFIPDGPYNAATTAQARRCC